MLDQPCHVMQSTCATIRASSLAGFHFLSEAQRQEQRIAQESYLVQEASWKAGTLFDRPHVRPIPREYTVVHAEPRLPNQYSFPAHVPWRLNPSGWNFDRG